MKLTASQMASMLGIVKDDKSPILTLLTDSRDLAFPTTTAFFALRTAGNDGHNYLPELYRKGVRHFVVDSERLLAKQLPEMPDAEIYKVPSTLEALQEIGSQARKSLGDIPVVAITGSKGKTLLKEMLAQLLSQDFTVARSPRSYNSQIGVPLSLWEAAGSDAQIGIFEAGISQKGEMERLQAMIQPRIGAFTSITDEHSDGFVSLEEKAMEKAKLFANAEVVYYPAGEELIEKALKAQAPGALLRPVASAADADVRQRLIDMAAAMAESFSGHGYSQTELSALRRVMPPRIDVRDTLKNCIIIYDGFTLDMRSISDALNFSHRHLTASRTLTAIIGCPAADPRIGELPAWLKAKGVSRFIGVGFDPDSALANELRQAVEVCDFVASPADFSAKYTISDFADEAILVKGPAGAGFEEITTLLETPRHETVMEIDLDAVVRNFNYYRSLIPQGNGLVAMVKAAGYGVGSLELAKTMQSQGAAYLAVAVIAEGEELRRAGITMPIIVMNPITTNFKALFDNKLEPSVFSIRELRMLIDNAKRLGVVNYPVHIKLDTGMHRLGFLDSEIPDLLAELKGQQNLRVASIFSHLATADCLDQNAYTEQQLQAFDAMSQRIIDGLGYKPKRHILNTAGIMRYPKYHYDMARLGIGLYGISPIPMDGKLAVVATLSTTIISIKHWDAGATIGYGRKGVITKPSVIATIPIGYADGLDRHLSCGGASFYVNGHMCPVVGNICMDQCMIDVTDADAHIGDKVEIFGPNAPIERLSDALGTIPYEILTSVSPRVKRIYFRQ